MNRLSIQERAKIVACLVEGCSIKTTTRLTGAAKRTITRLLSEMGTACRRFHDQTVVNIKTNRIQCDEIWSHGRKCEAAEESTNDQAPSTGLVLE